MNTVWPWTRACLTSLRPIGTALLFNRVLCVDWKRGASPYWLPQFSWKSEQHHLPPSHMALATTPRRQLPGNQTMLEPLAVVCVREFVFCLYAFKIRDSETAAEEMSFNKNLQAFCEYRTCYIFNSWEQLSVLCSVLFSLKSQQYFSESIKRLLWIR